MNSKILILLSFFASMGMLQAQEFSLNPLGFSNQFALARVIEPTSPVLGTDLVTNIRNSQLHPEDIYIHIQLQNEALTRNLNISSLSYFEALTEDLNRYCNGTSEISTGEEDSWTTVEQAAIPLEVLEPLQNKYVELINQYSDLTYSNETLEDMAKEKAKQFQTTRKECKTAKRLAELEAKLEKYCLGLKFCKKAKNINSIISSAEGSFPRKQFSINGFTRYVYNSLLETDINVLEKTLKAIYDLEKAFINNPAITQETFYGYVVSKSIEAGFHAKDIFLILAYSKRNMPSLDVEYGADWQKALLLEVYFWKFKSNRDAIEAFAKISDANRAKVYPGKVFDQDPGHYHYLTAALMGCEARLAGMSHLTAKLLGMVNKYAYKKDKLSKSIDPDRRKSEGRKYVKALKEEQAFKVGVSAGWHAAKYGSKVCKAYKKKLEKEYDIKIGTLKDRVKSVSERRSQIKLLKEELKVKIRGIF